MTKATIAIYGIKDLSSEDRPVLVHDHNICVMSEGKIIQYLHLERYTGRKHDNRLDLFIEELVEEGIIHLPEKFDFVCVNSFLGNGFISKNGKIRFERTDFHSGLATISNGNGKIKIGRSEISEHRFFHCSHELAHVGTCLPFFGSFRENSLLVHFDGGAGNGNFSAFHFIDGTIIEIESGWHMSQLSKLFNDNALVFAILNSKPSDHCSVPGKFMGYAAMGLSSEEILKWLKENDFFANHWDKESKILQSANNTFGYLFDRIDNTSVFWQNVAASIQGYFTQRVLAKLQSLQEKSNADFLYYSGGCALNIVTNSKIIASGIFLDVFIPPCCNDSGLSIGAAALLEWQKGNKILLHSPYLNNVGIMSIENTIRQEAIHQTAEILLKNGIVGICNAAAEAGPRALGNRSLIALANNKTLAQRLSMDIKKREWYRPVAPIMLNSIALKIIENTGHHLSQFMLLDFQIKKEFAKDFEGVIHANNTARIQTINSERDNPFMFSLLSYLFEKHGIKALINTSFNANGEPIVHTPDMAILAAKSMKIDAIIIDNNFRKL